MIQITAADLSARQSDHWHARLSAVCDSATARARSLLQARAIRPTAWYFQLERRGPIEVRLGPGLTRPSDSFWAHSEW